MESIFIIDKNMQLFLLKKNFFSVKEKEGLDSKIRKIMKQSQNYDFIHYLN